MMMGDNESIRDRLMDSEHTNESSLRQNPLLFQKDTYSLCGHCGDDIIFLFMRSEENNAWHHDVSSTSGRCDACVSCSICDDKLRVDIATTEEENKSELNNIALLFNGSR